MLNRRQMLANVAGGLLLGGAAAKAAAAQASARTNPEGWLPQLSESAQVLAQAESENKQFDAGPIHCTRFLPGVTLLACKSLSEDALDRLRMVRRTLDKSGLSLSKPGISQDGKTWVQFVCGETSAVAKRLGARAGKIERPADKAA